MTTDPPDEDRTVVRPTPSHGAAGAAAAAGGPAAAGFQPTALYGPPAMAPVGPPPATPGPVPDEDLGNGLAIGTRLGEFEITALIGEGGFGIVYLAIDHSLGRKVALKEYMPSALAARTSTSQVQVKSERHRETFEAGRKSFVNEARLLAQFDHPSLVKVYRFWEANGTAYMVMPFYEGRTLRDLLRENQRAGLPPPDEAWLIGLLAPLTEALLVIHAEQCYHRDIAPDNVMMLAGSQRPLLLDFGAARRVIGDMTQALTVILKPGYAPIEQYAEIPGMKQGAWTDVYALAAVVYYAITGKTPPPSVGRMLNDTYQPLAEVAAGRYSDEFLRAIDRALAVRPEERTQTIGEFRQQIGLSATVHDPYASSPLTQAPSVLTAMRTMAAPPPASLDGPGSPAAAAPVPRPAVTPPAPSVTGTAAAAAGAGADRKGGSAMVGIGIGVVVLAAVGFGVYSMMAPAPRPVAPPPQAAAPAAPPAADTAALPPVATAPAAPAAPPRFDALRELEQVVDRQTPGFGVRAETPRATLRIGRDEFKFSVTSDRDGFIYVLGHGPDGLLAQLVPNRLSGPAVRVRKGQTWRFPTGDGFFLATQEPAGPTHLLVLVSDRTRSFDDLRTEAAGEVRLFPAADVLATLAAARPAGGGPLLAGSAVCPDRNACVEDYGAALLRFETVR